MLSLLQPVEEQRVAELAASVVAEEQPWQLWAACWKQAVEERQLVKPLATVQREERLQKSWVALRKQAESAQIERWPQASVWR